MVTPQQSLSRLLAEEETSLSQTNNTNLTTAKAVDPLQNVSELTLTHPNSAPAGSAHVAENGIDRSTEHPNASENMRLNPHTNKKLVLVIVDGMSFSVARDRLGFVESQVEDGAALCTTVQSVLPSMSRVCYEAIFTGTSPTVNGILANEISRRSTEASIFDVLRTQNRTSAVFGYHWISELYQESPFDPLHHRDLNHSDHGITWGRFYFEDDYPDSHLYAEAEALRREKQPDLLVIHSMNVDLAGHRHGSDSKEYAAAVVKVDTILAMLVPAWLADGYQVMVTADHGMDDFGYHGGTLTEHRKVPLYLFSPALAQTGVASALIPQTSIAHLACRLLGVDPAPRMMEFSQEFYQKWFS